MFTKLFATIHAKLAERRRLAQLAAADAHHLLDHVACRSDCEALIWVSEDRLARTAGVYRRAWRRTARGVLSHCA